MLAGAAFLGFWEGAVRALDVPLYLLPAPSAIGKLIVSKWSTLVLGTAITFLEALLGFLLGCTVAFVTGSVFAVFRPVERAVLPLFVAFQAVPLVAVAPLLIIWFGNGLGSKVVMAAMICYFPMTISCATGIRNTSREMIDLMKILGAGTWQVFWKARLPSATPSIFAGLKIAAAMSVIGAIVAELSGANQGIGFLVLSASYRTDTPMLFAAIAFAALLGIGCYEGVCAVERRVLRSMGIAAQP